MVNYLGAPQGGPTVFSAPYGNQIGTKSQVLLQNFANGAIWVTPDDGWVVHPGTPPEMTLNQREDYAKDVWLRGGAQWVRGQALCDFWFHSLFG